ncbi:trace amine-associated receptor 13c-like [Neolamprologus brichardi]|uniref:trace amine-associated receptor 13c-like n=1 Tax=Neolamprologus brichardi TaxID=32507 RepID=UPI0016439DDA|nr:trace amine-associated receptor 13c-like [Neolamprologus brichardi]
MMAETELCFPNLNSSCSRVKRSPSESVLIYVILTIISLLTVALNLLVIISISHFKQLHTPTNYLLLSLAVSDFFVGFNMCFQSMLIDGCWYLGDLMCVLYYVFEIVVTSASVGTMVLISVDRYVAICDPLHYPTKVTPKRVQTCVLICWICSLLVVGVLLKDNLDKPGRFNSCFGECVIYIDFAIQVTDLIFTILLPITVIVILYVRVFAVAVFQIRAMQHHVAAGTQRGKVSPKKSELKAARTLGIVIVAFLICLFPYYCVILSGQDTLLDILSLAFFLCLFYFNSFLNPIIYALFYPWFRKSVKLIVTFQIVKSGSSDASML